MEPAVKFHHNRYDDAVDDGDRGGVSQCLRRSLHPAGTDVLRRDGGYRGQHGRRYQEQRADHLFDDADSCRIVQATVVGDDRDDDEGDLDAAVLNRRRHSDAENAAEHGPIGAKSPNFSLMPVRRRRIATNVTVTLMACASVVPNAAPEGPRRSQPINR